MHAGAKFGIAVAVQFQAPDEGVHSQQAEGMGACTLYVTAPATNGVGTTSENRWTGTLWLTKTAAARCANALLW